MGVGTHRNTKCPPETKISNFDGPLSVDEKVLGLQVTVDHSAHVHEDNSLQDLVGVALKGRNGRVYGEYVVGDSELEGAGNTT